MGVHKLKQGLRLPIKGEPAQTISDAVPPREVALLGADYLGMKPTMRVAVGDRVLRGQPVFDDKKIPGVVFTAPAAGTVKAINRGDRRVFQSLVIELDAAERAGVAGKGETVRFQSFTGKDPASLEREQVKALLVESGLWTALRARPFSRTADPATVPHSIFVTAIDTQPLAPSAEVVLQGRQEAFARGVAALARLTDGPVFVCVARGSSFQAPAGGNVRREEFDGPHPAGTVGVHIHHLDPVDRHKRVWHAGYQDVAAIGHLFATGELDLTRVVAFAGPPVREPQLLRTRLGAEISSLTAGRLPETGELRLISGSLLSGRQVTGAIDAFLGRYHQQVSVVAEDRRREFLGWLAAGVDKFSATSSFLSALLPGKRFELTTSTNGSPRAMVPIGLYEKVVPMDLLPTFLLRSLFVKDVEKAEELGALELDEEDLALCTFVCPGKTEWGPLLRDVLTTIEKEG